MVQFFLRLELDKAEGIVWHDQEFKARTREPVCLPHPHKLHKIRGIFEKFDTVLGNG